MRLIQSGPQTAQIMIVGEAPEREEDACGLPFIGQSGGELTRMLLEVGINRNDCFITNVCHTRPPNNDIDSFFHTKTESKALGLSVVYGRYPNSDITRGLVQLAIDINRVQPKLIIALGATALWALTGHSAIMNWRGSALYTVKEISDVEIPVLPTIHPANILRDWANRFLAVRDLRRCKEVLADGNRKWRSQNWVSIVRPTFDVAIEWLDHQLTQTSLTPTDYAVDIETRKGQIACVGISRNSSAICIPFLCVERAEGYWNAEEEHQIILKLRQFLTHPNTHCIFHNGAYDLQYFAKQLGFLPNLQNDTMIMQHVAFPGLRKSLAMCASLYCEYYKYWKDDGKEWTTDDEDQLWLYNCEDCVRTFEIAQVLSSTLNSLGLTEQYEFQCRELFPQVLRTMLRGVRIDMGRRLELDQLLERELEKCGEWITTAVGHELNPRSSKKMKELFYDDLQVPIRRSRKTGNPSLDDENLTKIAATYPLLRPLVAKILEFRSIGVFLSTFVRASVPPDGRMRCTYNITGTETFRFSSSSDSFDYGTNLQNIPAGDEE